MDRLWSNFSEGGRPSEKDLMNELREGVRLPPIVDPDPRDLLLEDIYNTISTIQELLGATVRMVRELEGITE